MPNESVVFSFALLPLNAERGAKLILGPALLRVGVNFRLASGAKGAFELPNSEGGSCFCTVDRSFGIALQHLNKSLLSWFEKLRCNGCICNVL